MRFGDGVSLACVTSLLHLQRGVTSFLDWLRLIAQGEGSRELGGQLGVNTHDSHSRRGCEPQALSGSKSKVQRRSM